LKLSELYEKLGIFYLGKEVDIKTQDLKDELFLMKSKNLTTHAAIIGMTGSGKTGLGIDLIEEAVLDKIPSIIIDPKGDMGDLLLAFDDFDPKKFEKWIDEGEASKKGVTKEELAKQTASFWENGIKSFGQDRDRVKRYKNGADFTIYTPGSTAGVSLSILDSFEAPSKEIVEDADSFAYIINASVSSILSLLDIKADPIKSPEYLLLSTIFKYHFKRGESITLETLIGDVTNPPFEKIGVLPLNSFYPQSKRLELAMLLNSVLSSPTFESWIKGEKLDINSLLYTKEMKPKVSILSIAHLNDNERMFFVTLFLNRYISWMRKQSGSGSLKTILYMDEIYGFFPSTANPPSKNPMLLLLKQARAYGVGVVLSTQNPVDLDYKGLSNIGTWFIGRLQTKQDVQRVINGLTKSSESSLDKNEIESLISNLKKRVFLYKSVHDDGLKLFTTRWVLSYLSGPLSKKSISYLMKDKKQKIEKKPQINQTVSKKEHPKLNTTNPILSANIDQYYLNPSNIEDNCYYEPYLLANATLKYYDTKRDIDKQEDIYLKYYLESDDDIDFDKASINDDDFDDYEIEALSNCSYEDIPSFIAEAKDLRSLEKEFKNYLYHNKRLKLYRIKELKIESSVDESIDEFKIRVINHLKELKDEQIQKLEQKYQKEQDKFEKRYARAIEKLEKEKDDLSHNTTNALLSFGMTLLDAFSGRSRVKRSTTSKLGTTLRGAGRVYREKGDVQRAKDRVDEIEDEIENLGEKLEDEIKNLDTKYDINNFELEEFFIKPRRSDIYDVEMGILWSGV